MSAPAYFQPARLRLARELRGLSRAETAKGLQVSGAAVSQYESGEVSPSSDVVDRAAVLLGCKPQFFYRREVRTGPQDSFFRRRRDVPKRELLKADAYALFLAEATTLIEHYVELPANRFVGTRHIDDSAQADEIEVIANTAREFFGVEEGPVPNVVRLAEANGAAVAAVGAFDRRIDAFSKRTSSRPFIVLCSDSGSAARRRFDAAHEIGHLVMHDGPLAANRTQEIQAHRFASAFLMPAAEIEPWLPRVSNQLGLLEEGSRAWGVSMQALLRRALDLGTLSEDSYRRTLRRMTAAGWRTREPVELGPAERPELLSMAVRALPEAGSSSEDIAQLLGIPPRRFRRMLSVPDEQRDSLRGEVVELRSLQH